MVLKTAYTLSTHILPPKYYTHAIITGVAGMVTYAFAQGRTTTRERDLHARTILITGAFTPLGLTLVTSLASRGAHIIALSDYPLDHSFPSLLIPLLRSTTKNEEIYAEYADFSSPASLKDFCTRFLTGEDHRLDAILFVHEYQGVGSLLGQQNGKDAKRSGRDETSEKRETLSLATFLIITLLLPKLLVAPIERDIRIINVINPFYAAAVPQFVPRLTDVLTRAHQAAPESRSKMVDTSKQPKKQPLMLEEGFRSLRAAVFTRHLQRVLNALPNAAPGPDTSKETSAQPGSVPSRPQKPKFSNIIAASAVPGITRSETVSSLLNADRSVGIVSWFTLAIYISLYPLIWLFAKSSKAAQQTVLHVLFLPTPFKQALAHVDAVVDPSSFPSSPPSAPKEQAENSEENSDEKRNEEKDGWEDPRKPLEVLKPGALYRECAIVSVKLPSLPPPPPTTETKEKADKKGKGKEREEFVVLEDDGEFGGESLGRMVWEWYEMRLKEWEAREKREKPELAQEGSKPQQQQGSPNDKTSE